MMFQLTSHVPKKVHRDCYCQTNALAPELDLWGAGARVGVDVTTVYESRGKEREKKREELDLFPQVWRMLYECRELGSHVCKVLWFPISSGQIT